MYSQKVIKWVLHIPEVYPEMKKYTDAYSGAVTRTAASLGIFSAKAAAVFIAVFSVIVLFFISPASAAGINGISVSDKELSPGERFTVIITVPAADQNADAASLRIKYDGDIFEPVIKEGWPAAGIPNALTGSGDDFIALSAGNSERNIDLSDGLTVTADFTVKANAAAGNYSFQIDRASLSCYQDDGITLRELWEPKTTTAYVTVSDYTGEPEKTTDTVKGGGISSSASSVKRGGTFSVYINVPKIAENADTASVLASFNSDVFEVVSWSPEIPGTVFNDDTGFFALSASNPERNIDLSKGITLEAVLRAKANTAASSGVITLKRSSFAYVKANGYDYQELWQPSVNSVKINITKSQGSETPKPTPSYTIPTNTAPYSPTTQSPSTTASSRTSAVTLAPVIITSSQDETTMPADDYDDDEPFYDPEPPTDDNYDPYFPEDDPDDLSDEFGESTSGRRINVSLDQDLSGLGGEKIRIKTKYEFFEHDVIIIIKDLPNDDPDAVSALRLLGMSGHSRYPFDVSVYDTYTGTYISHLPDGAYIEITIPLPASMTGFEDTVEMYHIVNGKPEYISSSIIEEQGVKKIVFRANTFSPFMIVNTAYTSDPEIVMPQDIPAPRSDGIVNPATGAAAAVGIPAVMIGCIFLARKTHRRRKRTKTDADDPVSDEDTADKEE